MSPCRAKFIWEKSSMRREFRAWSTPPNPAVSICVPKLRVAMSLRPRLAFSLAAQPPLLSKSVTFSSLTHTVPPFVTDELFLTPIIMTLTSLSEGLPITEMTFCSLSGSRRLKRVANPTPLPSVLFSLLRSIFTLTRLSSTRSSLLDSGHTSSLSARVSA